MALDASTLADLGAGRGDAARCRSGQHRIGTVDGSWGAEEPHEAPISRRRTSPRHGSDPLALLGAP